MFVNPEDIADIREELLKKEIERVVNILFVLKYDGNQIRLTIKEIVDKIVKETGFKQGEIEDIVYDIKVFKKYVPFEENGWDVEIEYKEEFGFGGHSKNTFLIFKPYIKEEN